MRLEDGTIVYRVDRFEITKYIVVFGKSWRSEGNVCHTVRMETKDGYDIYNLLKDIDIGVKYFLTYESAVRKADEYFYANKDNGMFIMACDIKLEGLKVYKEQEPSRSSYVMYYGKVAGMEDSYYIKGAYTYEHISSGKIAKKEIAHIEEYAKRYNNHFVDVTGQYMPELSNMYRLGEQLDWDYACEEYRP